MAKHTRQLHLLGRQENAHGGNRRKGRTARPLATQSTMHLVLRSTKAKGSWSFKNPKNAKRLTEIIQKFAAKNFIEIKAYANVGNHLHLHIRLSKRHLYKPFIRAVTSAIATAVAGKNWRDQFRASDSLRETSIKSLVFWDYRPFTRIVAGGLRSFLKLRDYIRINQFEGMGASRGLARAIVAGQKNFGVTYEFR